MHLETPAKISTSRQFLFRQKDVGRPKSIVAAEAIMARVAGCTVEAHHAKIQDFDADFYRDVRRNTSNICILWWRSFEKGA